MADTTTTTAPKKSKPPLEIVLRGLKLQRQAIEANKDLAADKRDFLADFFAGAEVVFANPPMTMPEATTVQGQLVAIGRGLRESRAVFFGKA